MNNRLYPTILASMLILGLAPSAQAALQNAPAPAPRPRGEILPAADHAAHIFSPAVGARWMGQLPAIPVPRELRRLLDERARTGGTEAFRDRLAIRRIYTDDAVVLGGSNNWSTGPVIASIFASLHASSVGQSLRGQSYVMAQLLIGSMGRRVTLLGTFGRAKEHPQDG